MEVRESVSAEVGQHHRVIPSGSEVALEAAVALKEWQPRLVEYYVVSECGGTTSPPCITCVSIEWSV